MLTFSQRVGRRPMHSRREESRQLSVLSSCYKLVASPTSHHLRVEPFLLVQVTPTSVDTLQPAALSSSTAAGTLVS